MKVIREDKREGTKEELTIEQFIMMTEDYFPDPLKEIEKKKCIETPYEIFTLDLEREEECS